MGDYRYFRLKLYTTLKINHLPEFQPYGGPDDPQISYKFMVQCDKCNMKLGEQRLRIGHPIIVKCEKCSPIKNTIDVITGIELVAGHGRPLYLDGNKKRLGTTISVIKCHGIIPVNESCVNFSPEDVDITICGLWKYYSIWSKEPIYDVDLSTINVDRCLLHATFEECGPQISDYKHFDVRIPLRSASHPVREKYEFEVKCIRCGEKHGELSCSHFLKPIEIECKRCLNVGTVELIDKTCSNSYRSVLMEEKHGIGILAFLECVGWEPSSRVLSIVPVGSPFDRVKRVTRQWSSVPKISKDKEHMNLVVMGQVSSGKSTTIGHLMSLLGAVDQSVERECGRTIEISMGNFETRKYICTMFDGPGVRSLIRNMITSISQADCAILIIDPQLLCYEYSIGVYGQTREHSLIAFALGIKQIICCVNKMDALPTGGFRDGNRFIEYHLRYRDIVCTTLRMLMEIGFRSEDITFVPISGIHGYNMIERSIYEWFKGPNLLEAIDSFKVPRVLDRPGPNLLEAILSLKVPRVLYRPLRLPLQDVYKIGDIGTVAVGRGRTGKIEAGMELTFGASGITSKAHSLLTFGPSGITSKSYSLEMPEDALKVAGPDRMVGVLLKDVALMDLKRGDVASNSLEDPARCAASFVARIIILKCPRVCVERGTTADMHCHTSHVVVEFVDLLQRIKRRSGRLSEENPKCLRNGEAGIVKIVPKEPVVVEPFIEYPSLGRFVVRAKVQTKDLPAQLQTIAVGVILSVEKKDAAGA